MKIGFLPPEAREEIIGLLSELCTKRDQIVKIERTLFGKGGVFEDNPCGEALVEFLAREKNLIEMQIKNIKI